MYFCRAYGNEIWSKLYHYYLTPTHYANFPSVKPTADGGFIVAAELFSYYAWNNYPGGVGSTTGDIQLLKLDSLGTIEWSKIYGDTSQVTCKPGEIRVVPGGYVVSAQVRGTITNAMFYNNPRPFFFKVNNSLKLPKNTGVLTFAALEQTAKKYKNFINYLLKNNPNICVHVECMENMYNKKNKIDHLGYKYHMQRAYLQNFIPYLLKLSKEKKLKIIKIKRLFFGSYYHEVYNYVVWKPLI